MGERGKRLLRRTVEVTDKLDLPAVLAPSVPRMELVGSHSFYMDRHRGVLPP